MMVLGLKMASRAAMIVALVVCLAACGGSGTTAPSGEASSGAQPSLGSASASAIIDTLGAAGLSCANVAAREGATHVADEARCSIGNDDVVIRTFATPEDRDSYLEASGNVVGQLSFDVEAVPQLIGPSWIISTDTRETAEQIRAILGGELH